MNGEESVFLPCTRSRLRIWFHETGTAVPSGVSLLILHAHAESGAYSQKSSRFPRWRPSSYLNRHTPSGQSRMYQATKLRTNGVHCRVSAGTGPVVLKVVPEIGAAFSGISMDPFLFTYVFPHLKCMILRPGLKGQVTKLGRGTSTLCFSCKMAIMDGERENVHAGFIRYNSEQNTPPGRSLRYGR